MLPGSARLLKDEEEIRKLLVPMVPEFCESINHKEVPEDVTDIVLNTDGVDSFVFFENSKPVGFTTYMLTDAFGIRHLHQCHGYFKPDYRHLAGNLYDLTSRLVHELEIDKISFTFINKKVAKRVSSQLQKRGINLRYYGYYYQAIMPKEN